MLVAFADLPPILGGLGLIYGSLALFVGLRPILGGMDRAAGILAP